MPPPKSGSTRERCECVSPEGVSYRAIEHRFALLPQVTCTAPCDTAMILETLPSVNCLPQQNRAFFLCHDAHFSKDEHPCKCTSLREETITIPKLFGTPDRCVTGSLVRQNDAYHVRRGINASCRHGRNDIEYFREKVWRPKHPGYSRRPTTGGPIQNQWLLRSLRSAARSPRDPR